MRTRLRSKVTFLFMMCAVLLAIPAVALADVVNVVDVGTSGNATKAAGASGTAKVWLQATDEQPSNGQNDVDGCNASATAPVTVRLTSNNTNVIANPGSAQVTACGEPNGNTISYKVASDAAPGTVVRLTADATNNTGVPGATRYESSSFTVTVSAPAKQNQTITFDQDLSNVTYGDTVELTASASSGLPVTYETIGDNCSVSNGTLTATGAGTCTVTANQAGNASFNPADSVQRIFDIARADAVIDVQGYTGVYDGNPHGATGTATGVGGADLSSLLVLGDSFTDVPGGTANWSFAGNDNYNPASGTAKIVINKADATIDVNGYTGTYDGNAHGATGTATGVEDEDLSGLLDFGDSFTDAPGGTANWSFAGNGNYNSDNGTAQIVINKATPQITWSNPAAIDYGTALGAAQLNASVKGVDNNVLPGNSVYNPAAGTVLKAGTQSLKVDFTPADSGNYSEASKSVTIVVNPYSFTGFFQPIDNGGVLNSAKAGSTIPVKFSLGGDKGMDILAQAPTAGPIKCDPTAATDPLEEVSTATVSGLKYDPTANQYIYNWKTSTSYAGTCQQLVVRLADGTTVKSANFKFAK